jgi:hypothetical protein
MYPGSFNNSFGGAPRGALAGRPTSLRRRNTPLHFSLPLSGAQNIIMNRGELVVYSSIEAALKTANKRPAAAFVRKHRLTLRRIHYGHHWILLGWEYPFF